MKSNWQICNLLLRKCSVWIILEIVISSDKEVCSQKSCCWIITIGQIDVSLKNPKWPLFSRVGSFCPEDLKTGGNPENFQVVLEFQFYLFWGCGGPGCISVIKLSSQEHFILTGEFNSSRSINKCFMNDPEWENYNTSPDEGPSLNRFHNYAYLLRYIKLYSHNVSHTWTDLEKRTVTLYSNVWKSTLLVSE